MSVTNFESMTDSMGRSSCLQGQPRMLVLVGLQIFRDKTLTLWQMCLLLESLELAVIVGTGALTILYAILICWQSPKQSIFETFTLNPMYNSINVEPSFLDLKTKFLVDGHQNENPNLYNSALFYNLVFYPLCIAFLALHLNC